MCRVGKRTVAFNRVAKGHHACELREVRGYVCCSCCCAPVGYPPGKLKRFPRACFTSGTRDRRLRFWSVDAVARGLCPRAYDTLGALKLFYGTFCQQAEVAGGFSCGEIFFGDESILKGSDVTAREPQRERPHGRKNARRHKEEQKKQK